jgi:hypothetical protein
MCFRTCFHISSLPSYACSFLFDAHHFFIQKVIKSFLNYNKFISRKQLTSVLLSCVYSYLVFKIINKLAKEVKHVKKRFIAILLISAIMLTTFGVAIVAAHGSPPWVPGPPPMLPTPPNRPITPPGLPSPIAGGNGGTGGAGGNGGVVGVPGHL